MSSPVVGFFMRTLLKLAWSKGGAHDGVDGLPRLTAADVASALPHLRAGDFVLLGNNGAASHVAVYLGNGQMVHSMATEKTMRGGWGTIWDALWRPWRWLRNELDQTGVLTESLASFVTRFERDTWLALRCESLTPAQVQAGLERVRGHIGKAYDYNFHANDDQFYCTELVVEFLDAASEQPIHIPTRRVRVPLLLDSNVVEPVALLQVPELRVVAANSAASSLYAEHLGSADIEPTA